MKLFLPFICAASMFGISSLRRVNAETNLNRKLKLVDENMKLCSKREYDEFMYGTSKFTVVVVAGTFRSGKSALLNNLFFNGEQVFKVHQKQTDLQELKNETVGIDAVLTKYNIQEFEPSIHQDEQPSITNKQHVLLVCDSEGLFAPDPASLIKSQVMSIRTLGIADIILYNSPGVNTAEVRHMQNAIHAIEYDFDTAPARSPFPRTLLFFQQRVAEGMFINSLGDIHKFFVGNKIPLFIGNLEFANSGLGKKINNNVYLDLSQLKFKLDYTLKKFGDCSTTPSNFWQQLKFFDDNLPSQIQMDKLPPSNPTGCTAACRHCSHKCDKISYIKHYQHANRIPCTHSNSNYKKVTSYYCNRCSNEFEKKMEAEWSRLHWFYFWNGARYKCTNPEKPNNHGIIGYHCSWFGLCEGDQKFVYTEKQHDFPVIE